jgi:predicted RNA-binding Zn-ribbon protein involved in translation (DUF1610 family)
METNKECPICGSKEIGKGKLSGYAKMMPVNRLFTTGSEVVADICTKCGHILSLNVTNPKKFK